MSAAQPADPHPYLDTGHGPDDAAVIPLNRRRNQRTPRGRWPSMRTSTPGDTPPQHAPKADTRDDHREAGALEAWAETIETSMLGIGQSLSDPRTRDAYLVTLAMWERILQGSHASGRISTEAFEELMVPLHGMRQAPGIIEQT